MKKSFLHIHLYRITSAIFLFLTLFVLCSVDIAAQTRSGGGDPGKLWRSADQSRVPERGRRQVLPERSVAFRLDAQALKGLMRAMPLEFTSEARATSVVMEVPMPDGSLSRFRIEDSPVLAPHLAEAFPAWRTFHGYGVDDPLATARFDWTKTGFHGYVLTGKGTVYIDPMQENDTENYLVYYKHEYGDATAFRCGVEDAIDLTVTDLEASPASPAFSFGSSIRTYRLAIATTGEWARGTTTSTDPQTVRAAALAAMTTSVNRLDGIFRKELGVSLLLVNPPITNDATNIIYDDPATDPYNNTDQEAQLNINQTTIDTRVGTANYDVGHLYGTGGGGVASAPSICSVQKAEGYSARAGFYGDPFTVDYVAHEIGHQFGGSHTYNNRDDGGACTTRSNSNAFEVASGSTIMSYVGICNIRNLQQYVDTGSPAFHIRSLTQMVANMQNPDNGGSCGTTSGTNAVPTVNAGANFTIPKLTPFTLTAQGNDADPGDVPNLTYSWEQYDLSPSGTGQLGTPPLGFDVDTDGVLRSLFRAYSPVTSASRTFPSMAFVLNTATNNPAGSNNPPFTYQGTHPTGAPGATCQAGNDCVIGESLPSVARTMNFRVAIRDGRGGIADSGMTVTTVNTSEPFQVTVQNTPSTWAVGSTQTVTWDVVGTDGAPISATNVNILLSTDGGQSFPITLLANAPNNGTAQVTVPNNATAQARIKVAGAGNIFFDINNANFEITGGSPAVSVGNATGGEGPTGDNPEGDPLAFTITLSSASAQPVTVRVNTNGITATEGGDFESVDNLDVVFPAGTLSRTVSVPIIEDPGDEPDETFSLDVASVTGATVSDGQGIGTIIDDDPPAIETMEFSSVAYTDDESQFAVVTVSRVGDLLNPSSVAFATVAGGTATGGATCTGNADYISQAATNVAFAVGEATRTVSVELCRDVAVDADETFQVRLTNPVGGGLGTPSIATVRINDTANQHRNTTAISTFQGIAAAPYPSNIVVTGGPSNVQRVRVTLYDLYHSFPDNLKILLVNPQGRTFILMGDAGGPQPIVNGGNVTVTFTDTAARVLPDSTVITTGLYEPTSWETTVNNFPSPAPAGPYPLPGSTIGGTSAQTLIGNFGQLDGNGTWSLYIRDDNGGNAPQSVNGGVNGGWGLELLSTTAAGVEVSGRVTTPDGRGLRNAVVSMVDSQGVVRTATTSSFGYYSFDGVEAGSSVVMNVQSRRYRFAPRIVQVIDTLTDVDFTGQE